MRDLEIWMQCELTLQKFVPTTPLLQNAKVVEEKQLWMKFAGLQEVPTPPQSREASWVGADETYARRVVAMRKRMAIVFLIQSMILDDWVHDSIYGGEHWSLTSESMINPTWNRKSLNNITLSVSDIVPAPRNRSVGCLIFRFNYHEPWVTEGRKRARPTTIASLGWYTNILDAPDLLVPFI